MPAPGTGWGRVAPDVDAAFVAGAVSWMRQSELAFVGHVWAGYDRLERQRPALDPRDLERCITQLLDGTIQDEMSGDEPYYIQHEAYERETMLASPAQPPAYDLAFVFRADTRVMWPLEAKILTTPRSLADYVRDVRNEFLTCRYAPFSPSGGMVGYLLQGAPNDALVNIATQLQVALNPISSFSDRDCAKSTHARIVPTGKPYPPNFDCHHIILPFHGAQRASGMRPRARADAAGVEGSRAD